MVIFNEIFLFLPDLFFEKCPSLKVSINLLESKKINFWNFIFGINRGE